LIFTNHVIVETFALAQRRLGLDAVQTLQEDSLPVVAIHWGDAAVHAESVASLLIAARSALSLVDCVSFNIMRETGLEVAFAIDRHFPDQGFSAIP